MSETLGEILGAALDRMEIKQSCPYESDRPKNYRPTLEMVADKVANIVQSWDHSRNDPDFSRHVSDGPLQLTPWSVHLFEDFVQKNADKTGHEVTEGVSKIILTDMLVSSERQGIGEVWREQMVESALREGRFTFDPELVNDLKRDENPVEIEERAGEGWELKDWAVKFAEQGHDVSGRSLVDQVEAETLRLVEAEFAYREEMDRMNNLQGSRYMDVGQLALAEMAVINGEGADRSLSFKEGLEAVETPPAVQADIEQHLGMDEFVSARTARSADGNATLTIVDRDGDIEVYVATAEAIVSSRLNPRDEGDSFALNWGAVDLERPSDERNLGSITYVGEGLAERDEDFRRAYMLPGEEVRLNPKMDISYVDMGALEKQFGDEVLKVEETRLTLTENAWIKPEYKFEGHDGYHTAQAFEHPNGIVHEFGIMAERDDKLWFVPLHDLDGEAKGAAREVVALEGRYAEHSVPEGLGGFTADVKAEPKSGEIAFIPTERGSETGPVLLAGVPWMSGVSDKEMEVANKAIDQALAAEAKSQGLLQQAEGVRGSTPKLEVGEAALRNLSRGPSDGMPQMPSRSMER